MGVSCLRPRIIFNKYTKEMMCVPCGKCSACKTLSSSLWVKRLEEESACHTYTVFLTLTYTDEYLPKFDIYNYDRSSVSDTFEYNLRSLPAEYIEKWNGLIPIVCCKDVQDFLKRLRITIKRKLDLNENESYIRAFYVSEYGPTSWRPHYHLLLWFDSPKIASTIKEYIHSAWKCKNSCKTSSEFFRRNKCKFVRGKAERYVAGYLNCFSRLPAIFYEKPFRTFHYGSKCPPIGTLRIFKERFKSLLFDHVGKVALGSPVQSRFQSVPVWRYLESRYAARCPGFSRISHRDRIILYKFSDYFGIDEGDDFETFSKRLLSQWFSSQTSFVLFRRVFRFEEYFARDSKVVSEGAIKSSPLFASLRRWYYISRRLRLFRLSIGLSHEEFVAAVEHYHECRDYDRLFVQMKQQEDFSRSPLQSLKFYPLTVDLLFYENLRSLPDSVRNDYLTQFGIGLSDLANCHPCYSRDFRQRAYLTNKICDDSTKCRIRKEYVSLHPEYASMYLWNANSKFK